MAMIVVSLGGSLLYGNGGKFDAAFAKKLAASIIVAKNSGCPLILVVGGGKRAREYANKARAEGKGEFFADREAIKATRENANEMIKLLGEHAYGQVALSFDDSKNATKQNKILVSGGMLEGLTTDAVSVLFAEMVRADAVVNLGDTAGIYSADPKKDPKALRISKMSHSELVDLAVRNDQRKAGTHFIFDLVASKLSARSNIELRFIDGRNLSEVAAALSGRRFRGTVVKG
ncbi:MAG: UMP kinase [Candidatus Micrarchaeota archaeon]